MFIVMIILHITHIKGNVVLPGKRNTQCIERKHLSLRTWCSCLVWKGLGF